MLQVKDHWWSRWEKNIEDEYREEGKGTGSFYPMFKQEELFLRFKKRADELMSEEVVYVGCKGDK